MIAPNACLEGTLLPRSLVCAKSGFLSYDMCTFGVLHTPGHLATYSMSKIACMSDNTRLACEFNSISSFLLSFMFTEANMHHYG